MEKRSIDHAIMIDLTYFFAQEDWTAYHMYFDNRQRLCQEEKEFYRWFCFNIDYLVESIAISIGCKQVCTSVYGYELLSLLHYRTKVRS